MAGGQVRRVSWPSWRVDVTVSFDSITTATSQKEEAAVVTRFIIFSSSHPAATIKCLPTPPTPCITRLTGRVNHPPPEESTNSRILLGVKKKNCRSFNPNVVVLAFKYAPTHMSTDVHFIVGRLDASFPPQMANQRAKISSLSRKQRGHFPSNAANKFEGCSLFFHRLVPSLREEEEKNGNRK